ncbi:hypothetical protein ZHAS_00002944 [Anopheles sinensis]|uniref:Uncharacterized protein n=1 Tax=Anopheles sinensis TaxID=74873 RepID=A0A084VDC1_ANOSI|nr:hypothetical protein ZHAS_00002944 [Anopheles sinensis]
MGRLWVCVCVPLLRAIYWDAVVVPVSSIASVILVGQPGSVKNGTIRDSNIHDAIEHG